MVKNWPAMQEIWIQPLGWEDHLEKGMATYSSILARRIPWTEEPGGLQSRGRTETGMTEQLTHFFHFTVDLPYTPHRFPYCQHLVLVRYICYYS